MCYKPYFYCAFWQTMLKRNKNVDQRIALWKPKLEPDNNSAAHIYIYIYTWLGSGPIFAILKFRFWTNSVLRCFFKLNSNSTQFCLFWPQKVDKMKVRFRTKKASLEPQIGPEPNFHLGQNLTFKNGPFYQSLLWNHEKIVFSESYTWKQAR